jgi:cytidylate kinase
MGDLHRQMAEARGMSALQLNIHAERDETVDDRIDQLQAKMAKSGERLVVDSRLAWFFFTDAFKVHLIVDPTVAAQRVMSRPASDVESYPSVKEAINRLQERADSERLRFLRKYKIDKARLRNYDLICDSTRARPEDICDDIIAALNGDFGAAVISGTPPLLDLDPSRIYPTRDIKDPGFASGAGHRGDPIAVAYCDRYFYVIDGHRRLSAAIRDNLTLIPARLVAEADEPLAGQESACDFFRTGIAPDVIRHWEAVHQMKLPPVNRSPQQGPGPSCGLPALRATAGSQQS